MPQVHSITQQLLPTSLIARILTYNVADIKDVAQLRLVGKALGQQAIHMLPLQETITSSRHHWIRCFGRRRGLDDVTGSFTEQFCDFASTKYDLGVLVGDVLEVSRNEISLIEPRSELAAKTTVHVVGRTRSLHDFITNSQNKRSTAFNKSELEYLEKLASVCESMLNASTVEQFLADDADEMVFFDPPPGISDTTFAAELLPARQEYILFSVIPAMVTFEIDPTATYVSRIVQVNNMDKFYLLNILVNSPSSADTLLQPLFPGGQVWAVDAGPEENGRLVRMLLYLQADADGIVDQSVEVHSRLFWLNTLWGKHQRHELVEGVVVVDDFISTEFQQLLNAQVNDLVEQQDRDHAVDYHPHSNHMVRDLVHPALYSYIHNVTPLMAHVQDVEPCTLPAGTIIELTQTSNQDVWLRMYETSPYQWLPSYVSISTDGKCQFDTYINNLTPRDDPVCSALNKSLEGLLEHALPFIESILSYVYAVRPLLRGQVYDWKDDDDEPLSPIHLKPINLRGQKLQVITKIVDYELTPQHDTYEGVWHVEGMSHEEIVLTCLYILDRDESIEGGGIEFKRAFLEDEAQHICTGGVPYNRPLPLDQLIETGVLPLGTVETLAGRLVVFPNLYVHRVKEMKLVRRQEQETDEKHNDVVSKCRIVVFFLVNPQKRIVSTREVAPQQMHSGGDLPHAEALQHRLALMAERKHKKQDWNIRKIHLCEH